MIYYQYADGDQSMMNAVREDCKNESKVSTS